MHTGRRGNGHACFLSLLQYLGKHVRTTLRANERCSTDGKKRVEPEKDPRVQGKLIIQHRWAKGTKPIEIKVQDSGIRSVAFLADGKHFVSGDKNGNIRCRRMEDGKEVGRPMDAGSAIRSIAVSQDGKWIVAGTSHKMIVWNAKSREKVNEFEHQHGLLGLTTLDVSPDGTKIASGLLSNSGAAVVWSRSTGRELFKWEYFSVWTVKFSCDSSLLATGGQCNGASNHFLRVYNSQNGHHLVDIQFRAYSLAWASDNKQLFALSPSGRIRCLDVSSGNTLSEWSVSVDTGSKFKDMSLSMSSNDMFISSCANELLSFWDFHTRERIGSVVHLPYSAKSMAMSAKYDLVIGGEQGITLFNLREILPSPYIDDRVSGYLFSFNCSSSQTALLITIEKA